MELVFVANKCLPFHAGSLEERPLGGIETAVIRLAQALQERGHAVTVFTAHDSPPESVPKYVSLNEFHRLKQADALIAVRDWVPVFTPLKVRKRFFWTGDAPDQVHTFGIGDRRIIQRLDGLLTVSAWHAATLAGNSGFPLEKTWVVRNGVHLADFEGEERRLRKRLIYSSTPYRGLVLVPGLYAALREAHPDCELHIFSGFDVYGGAAAFEGPVRDQFEAVKAKLSKIPGVTFHGNVLQKMLAREFMRSSILFYPNIFPETSCITALEAQAAGCAIVTSDLGALKETVGEAGVLVPGRPDSAEYQKAFLEACNRILSDDAVFEKYSQAGKTRVREQYGWPRIAEQFEDYLNKVHGL